MIERFIPGYPGYSAGEDGQIRKNGKVVKSYPQKNGGHLRIWIKLPHWSRAWPKFVHHLVAKAFNIHNPRPDIFCVLDHVDRDEINNRPWNLRYLTHSLNMLNNDSLGHFDKRLKMWRALVSVEGTRHYLGYYKTFLEMYRVRKEFRQKAFNRIYSKLVADGPQQSRAGRFVSVGP